MYGFDDLVGDVLKSGQASSLANTNGWWGNQNVNDSGWWNYMTQWGNANYNRQNELDQLAAQQSMQGNSLASQERIATIGADASKYPHELKQQRFNTVFPWIQGQVGSFGSMIGQGNPKFGAQSAPAAAAAPAPASAPSGQAPRPEGDPNQIQFRGTSSRGGGPVKWGSPYPGGGPIPFPTGGARPAPAPAPAPAINFRSAPSGNPVNPYFDRTGIDVNPLFSQQQIQQKLQNVQGNNTAAAQGSLRRAQEQMGPDAYNQGGRNALARQYQLQALDSNNQASIDIPMQLGKMNSDQLLAQQSARNQGALGWANNDLGYDQMRTGQMNAILAMMGGMV